MVALWGISQWNDSETVLADCCCYDYGANASEAVQKIDTNQKNYHKCC